MMFSNGAAVVVKNDWPEARGPAHVRTPHYLRGHKGRVDANHGEVATALLAMGCSVQSLAVVGLGCPDLMAAKWDVTCLFEVKDGSKRAPSGAC